MDESFAFGKRARRTPAIKRSRGTRPRSSRTSQRAGIGRVAALVVGGIVVVLAIAGYMTFIRSSGEEIASGERTAISHVGTANDVQAKMTAQQAASAVQQLYAEQGSYDAITPGALHTFEPSSTYTGGASSGPNAVSVASSANGVGLAVRSESGTCFLERFSATGVTYGTGATCTGQAAMSASAAGWPA